MKTTKFNLSLFLIFGLIPNFLTAQLSEKKLATIDSIMDAYIAEHDVPAISLGIVSDGKTYFLNKGFYKRDEEKPMDEMGAGQIASLSKSFTGIIIKELLAAGQLDVNRSIIDYLPKGYDVKIKAKLKGITVRELLHHRSGFPRDSKIASGKRKGNDPLIYDYTEADFALDFKQIRIKKNPKREFEYSNFAYAVLGYIAERASGQSYENLLQQYICQPYQLSHTTTKVPSVSEKVTPYYKEDRQRETQHFVMGKLTPPSGIFSTSEDLCKLLKQQLQVYTADQRQHALYLTEDALPKNGPAYGYGLFDYGNGGLGHGGDLDGYATNYWLYPEHSLGYAFLTSSGGAWVHSFALAVEAVLLK